MVFVDYKWWLSLPLAGIARIILFCTGWQLFTAEDFRKLEQYPRAVLVFSHSSRWDFVLMLLYRAAHPIGLSSLRSLVKPQAFQYAGWLLRAAGCIPSTRIEDKAGGAVDRIVNELQTAPRCLFAISPKGTTARNNWRSGYYHIAQKLKAPIFATGADYELKQPYVSASVNSDLPEVEVQKRLRTELGFIVPLYPESEVMPIRRHNGNDRGLVNWVCLGVWIGVLVASLLGW